MANTKSAAKRARQTKTRTLQNRRALSSLKNKLRSVRADIGAGKLEGAKAELPLLVSALDKAVKTGRIHRNAANRRKSRLGKAMAATAAK
jgi:small subunit ribosomal protein S20